MNNNAFNTSTTISNDYMLFPYNDNYYSQPSLSFRPSSSTNNNLIHSTSNTSNYHLDNQQDHQFLQVPSPFSQFEFVPDYSLLTSFLPQNYGHGDNQTTPIDHHHPNDSSHPLLLLPLNNPTKEQPLEPSEIITHIEDSKRISTSQDPKVKKVKKPRKTDRHSKIKTAKGTRDRRMRLSLDVAKELFGLQDMLGFDKASKTVEWLLTQAKPEIIKIWKKLPNQCGFSSLEEPQTRPASGSIYTSSDLCDLSSMWRVDDGGSNIYTTGTRENNLDGRLMRGKRNMLQPRAPILKKLSKDARAKARERAKVRTKEKMMKRGSQTNVIEEEANNRAKLKNNSNTNNKTIVDYNSIKATPCEEEFEELRKNHQFTVFNEIPMKRVNKFNSSLPVLNYHRSQRAYTPIEQQHQFTDLHHFFGKSRDLMYNDQNM